MDKIKEYKALYFKWHNPLCNYAFRIVKNRHNAVDIVQDVFLYVWERKSKLEMDTNFKSYLFQTTYHKCLNFLEQSKQMEFTEVSQLSQKYANDNDEFDREADIYLKKERIMKSLRHLPPKCKEVFVLSRQNGLTYGEIADNLGISKKTVENHMVKALSILRNNLKTI